MLYDSLGEDNGIKEFVPWSVQEKPSKVGHRKDGTSNSTASHHAFYEMSKLQLFHSFHGRVHRIAFWEKWVLPCFGFPSFSGAISVFWMLQPQQGTGWWRHTVSGSFPVVKPPVSFHWLSWTLLLPLLGKHCLLPVWDWELCPAPSQSGTSFLPGVPRWVFFFPPSIAFLGWRNR
jgi:hypothetical protein